MSDRNYRVLFDYLLGHVHSIIHAALRSIYKNEGKHRTEFYLDDDHRLVGANNRWLQRSFVFLAIKSVSAYICINCSQLTEKQGQGHD